MRVHLTLLAALLTTASPTWGEPPKHDAHKTAQASRKPAQVVLASADSVRAPTPDPQASSAPKRPAPRVTTCRCGDPLPGSETPEE